jgi:uncharacterized membrane-anchored protein
MANAAEEALTPEQQALIAKYGALVESLHPQSGDVTVAAANATLHLGNQYYFLSAEDAKRVLVDGWGNPADAVTDVLGMVFPQGKTFVDDTWGAVLTYSPDGYVSDGDAKSADYDEILRTSQSGEADENAERKSAGLPSVHLVGWAQPPTYDQQHHALIWAREIQFGDQPENVLNYDIRTLGRRGILSMNMVSGMSKLAEVRAAATDLQQIAGFNAGAQYTDYQAGDATAGYGLAGLVAAGLGAAAAKKLGLLAIVILFAKKFAVMLIALLAGVGAWVRRMFSRKSDETARDLRSS